MHPRPFHELATPDEPLEFLWCDKVIIATVLFSRPGGSGGH